MTKPPEPQDPKKHYSSVGLQAGSVQQDGDWNASGRRQGARGKKVEQDSDWNSPPRRRRSGFGRWALLTGGAAVLLAAVAGALVLVPRYGPLLALRPLRGPVANIVMPLQGAVVALHSTVGVTGEGRSQDGIRELQLWVNGQQWGSRTFDVPPGDASATWGWTPSGEGEHLLVVKAVSAAGETVDSSTVHVLAALAADVRFPASYTARQGDRVPSLAQDFGTTAEAILEVNPGLHPSAPLQPGTRITLPIPIGNASPGIPEGGVQPALPAEASKPAAGASLEQVARRFEESIGPQTEVAWRDFQISDGRLSPNQPLDLLHVYASIDGEHWQRLPADGREQLRPTDGSFDLRSPLQGLIAQAGADSVPVSLEAWGFRQGTLVFLGNFHGNLSVADGGPALVPTGSTELNALDYTYLGKKHFTKSFSLSGEQPSMDREFYWSTTLPEVTHGLWQVSTQAFPPGTSLNPPGLIHQGVTSAANGRFNLDFGDYFTTPSGGGGFWGDLGQTLQDPFDALSGKTKPTQTFSPWQPRFFLIRVIPMTGSPLQGDTAAQIAGPASPPVFVWYQPGGNPYKPTAEPNGPAYQATIESFTPFRPADPDYSACFISTFEVRDCHTVVSGLYTVNSSEIGQTGSKITPQQYKQCTVLTPAGQKSCGCPGVSCSGSSSSCSAWNPTTYGNCLADAGEWAAGALQDTYNFISGVYNKAVSFVKEMVAKFNPWCIQAKVAAAQFGGDTVTEEDVEDVCMAAAEIAVTAVQVYFGIPPSLPDFDKVMDEGLEYAISMTATEMGISCNPQCVALLKKGFQAVAGGQNLYQAGLYVGASMAADELNDLGYQCDAKCLKLIQDGVQGKATLGQASDSVLHNAALQITANLNNQGIPCDAKCQKAIELQLKAGAAVGAAATSASAQPKPVQFYEPHPLGVDQPALARVSIFRRYESAKVPPQDLSQCNLQVYTNATQTVSGVPMSGAPFGAQGLPLPVLEPGESITIPIILERKPFYTPPEYGLVNNNGWAGWNVFYYGANLQVKVTGTAFITKAAGSALPCIGEDTWEGTIPIP